MALDPSRQVFILSNQEAAAAAHQILGVQAVSAPEIDWPTVSGCRLVLWPTNTKLARSVMARNAAVAHGAGAASIKLIEPPLLTADGFDATTAADEGWDKPTLMDWLKAHAAPWEPPRPDIRTESEISGEEHVLPLDSAPVPVDTNAPLTEQWAMLGLECTKAGPVANEDTVMRILERHPDLSAICWFDEFLGRIMTNGAAGAREWSDADDVRLVSALQRELGITRIKVSHVRAAVIGTAFSKVRNCAQEWVRSHRWDGTERMQHFFPDAFGTPDTPYSRAVGRNFWISLVARVMQPGCKVDTMVILEGGQGAGKSSVLKAIGGEWFTVQHESVTGKGFFEVLQGKMLVEIAEMDAFGKAEVTRVKQVVSTEVDRYRESYGRYAKDHPRHSIFVGTTNKDDWNRDETGARRFWPIKCVGMVDIAAVRRNRAQLFAEALVAFNNGAKWWEMPEAETRAEQDARREEDPWSNSIRDWLADIYRTEVTADDVMRDGLGLRKVEMGKPQQMRVGSILRGLGWTKHHTVTGNVWRRPVLTT